ncbi:uncharacterized protein LOC121390265 [Gigantopelta aegis]|uniref:uncharacterized protein LOC121390265 n=1 Tax=Gigantopelta aegis TaxID=1735272 RepID=UPI001B88A1D8|nr:uncharacterized protein LOC121390265 [Gigantopelta aegis]
MYVCIYVCMYVCTFMYVYISNILLTTTRYFDFSFLFFSFILAITTPSTVELGEKCGSSNSTTAHCQITNSACVEVGATTGERRCQCVNNYVRSSDECTAAPTNLTASQTYEYDISDNHQGSVGVIRTQTYEPAIFLSSYQVTAYPLNGIFRATIIGGSSIQLDASKSVIPIGTHTVLLKVTARVDHLTIVDVVTVTVTVNRQFSAHNVVMFLSDGTLKSSIIDNVRARTGFQDMSYTLSVRSKGAEFAIRDDGMVYCRKNLNITALASESHVAVERWLNVTASKEGITKHLADYRILIIRNTYSTSLDENQDAIITEFDLLSDSFEFSAHDLPKHKFTLVNNHISVSMLDYENKNQYYFSLDVKIKGDDSAATKVLVGVTVNDMNNKRPVFSEREFHFNMLSNSLGNTLIGIVTASDKDTVGRLYYQIGSESRFKSYFNMEEEY